MTIQKYNLRAMREDLPYSSSLDAFYQAELNKIVGWCQKNVTYNAWYFNPNTFPSRIYFLYEQDLTMYLLKWGK
jgi:hypothetical protein